MENKIRLPDGFLFLVQLLSPVELFTRNHVKLNRRENAKIWIEGKIIHFWVARLPISSLAVISASAGVHLEVVYFDKF